ncbi:MAG TPA: D-xylose ABC transporter ATP-binding protein [Ruminococcaceae bacterium]|jgi:ABC-type sugar transport system ATPase subunit|nr:D-xylose ABC transporter ATP-binding protein [Oscillospiraceae bacterium]
MEDNILEMTGICKTFPGVKALDRVDFRVKRGEVHCLIGANGAGKSTLMKVLSGAYSQDSGEITFDGAVMRTSNPLDRKRAGIAIIYQELSLLPELSVAENVFINNFPRKNGRIDWKTVYSETEKLVKELNLNIGAKDKVSSLGIGERQLVELMKALQCNAKLIVMDEPSATLSKDEFNTLVDVIRNLKQKGITIIYISHRLEELFIVGDSITIMRDGRVTGTLQTNEINMDQLVEQMIGYRVKTEKIFQDGERKLSDEVILKVDGMSNSKIHDVSFELHKGEILGFYGLVGSGRTETLRTIYGASKFGGGSIRYKGKDVRFKSPAESIANGIGLLPKNRKIHGLVLGLPVWENMSMVSLYQFLSHGVLQYKKMFDQCNRYRDELKVKTPTVKTLVQNLSGGNQQKVILAKWIMRDCNVLLIDEPTQGIDVGAKDEIYKIVGQISERGKSIIIASSELEELMRICDRILVMYEGRVVKIYNNQNLNSDDVLQSSVSGR